MSKKPETRLQDRDARTGQFKPDGWAKKHPNTSVRERVPLPGKGRK